MAPLNDQAIRVVMESAQRRTHASSPASHKSLRRRLQQEVCPRCGALGIELVHAWRGCKR